MVLNREMLLITSKVCAGDVAQLVEQSLMTQESQSLNRKIGKILSTNSTFE